MPHRNGWKTLASRIAYANPWMRVREDSVLRPDGEHGIYGVVEVRPSVGVLAINSRREIALVGQWRYPQAKYTWEIPRGGSAEGESDLLDVARRELREEVGVEADHWLLLGDVDTCTGLLDEVQRLYVATGLRKVSPPGGDPSEGIALRWVPFGEALRMVLAGEISEGCSAIAILKTEKLWAGLNLPGLFDVSQFQAAREDSKDPGT